MYPNYKSGKVRSNVKTPRFSKLSKLPMGNRLISDFFTNIPIEKGVSVKVMDGERANMERESGQQDGDQYGSSSISN